MTTHKTNKTPTTTRAFTLLEMLLVIAIIAILAGIVIIAINPGRQLASARNAQRASDLRALHSAVQQYYIDNREYPGDLKNSDGTLKEVCDENKLPAGCVDLETALVPTYISAIPKDPQATSGTSYKIAINPNSKTPELIAPSSMEYGLDPVQLGTTTLVYEYAITFDPNGGIGSMSPQSINKGSSVNLKNNTFTKFGHTFAGWATAANGSVEYANGASYAMGSSNVNLYAKWTANPTYTVTYNANGGTGNVPATNSYENGNIVTVANGNNLSKAGHVFNGWNTASGGTGTNYAAASTFTMGSVGVTLYAKWETEDLCNNSSLPHAENPACWFISGTSRAWGADDVDTGDTNAISGKTNTSILLSLGGDFPAAEYCATLTEGGYGNWFLPSTNELEDGLNKYKIEYTVNPSWGGFTPNEEYWSSTHWQFESWYVTYYLWDDDWGGENSVQSWSDIPRSESITVPCLR